MVPPAPTRFSITIGCPNSIARRSNTRRGNTSAALPAPNGITALIRRDGQVSARAAEQASTMAPTHDHFTILFINRSGLLASDGHADRSYRPELCDLFRESQGDKLRALARRNCHLGHEAGG